MVQDLKSIEKPRKPKRLNVRFTDFMFLQYIHEKNKCIFQENPLTAETWLSTGMEERPWKKIWEHEGPKNWRNYPSCTISQISVPYGRWFLHYWYSATNVSELKKYTFIEVLEFSQKMNSRYKLFIVISVNHMRSTNSWNFHNWFATSNQNPLRPHSTFGDSVEGCPNDSSVIERLSPNSPINRTLGLQWKFSFSDLLSSKVLLKEASGHIGLNRESKDIRLFSPNGREVRYLIDYNSSADNINHIFESNIFILLGEAKKSPQEKWFWPDLLEFWFKFSKSAIKCFWQFSRRQKQ